MVYFAEDNCILQYIQVAGEDKLLGRKANVTSAATITRTSATGAACGSAGSIDDLCTRVYTVEYLGTNKDRLVLSSSYSNCYRNTAVGHSKNKMFWRRPSIGRNI